jgi:hypothetical protein
MFKKIALVCLTAFLFASPGFAQEGDAKQKFYNFDDLLINGAYKKPQVVYNEARKKLKFEALLSLKKDFLKRVEESSKDASLR